MLTKKKNKSRHSLMARLMAFVLSLATVFSSVPVNALAAQEGENAPAVETRALPDGINDAWEQDATSIIGSGSICAVEDGWLHLKADAGNGNNPGSQPAMFVNPNEFNFDEAGYFSFKMKTNNPGNDRFGVYLGYNTDRNGMYAGYDAGGWFWQKYTNGDGVWFDGNRPALPAAGAEVSVRLEWTADKKMTLTLNGIAAFTGEDFAGIADTLGNKIAFKCGGYSSQITDVYVTDIHYTGQAEVAAYTVSGMVTDAEGNAVADANVTLETKTAVTDEAGAYSFADVVDGTYTLTAAKEGYQTAAFEVTVSGADVTVAAVALTVEEIPERGKAWYKLTGKGSGHNYGNAEAPPVLLDNSKTMIPGDKLSLKLRPTNNWGVFYTYKDNNNWLYVGYDSSSKWYYQYKISGKESYPGISGLDAPVEGEDLNITMSVDRETLILTVNGVQKKVTNQEFFNLPQEGKFGVKTNEGSIFFTDVQHKNIDCMDDNWALLGSVGKKDTVYEAIVNVTGTVRDDQGQPLEDALVYMGADSVRTDAAGHYAFEGINILGSKTYTMAAAKNGYVAQTASITVTDAGDSEKDFVLPAKAAVDLTDYDVIESDAMKVYIGKNFPVVARYEMKSDAAGETYFRGNETALNTIEINGISIEPTVTVDSTTADARVYKMHIEKDAINLDMKVKVSVKDNDLTWEVTEIKKAAGCPKIATINIPKLHLLSVDVSEDQAVFAGAKISSDTTAKADTYFSWEDGFLPGETENYAYAFLSNGKLSAGLHSNSEAENDLRIVRNNGGDSVGLSSAVWYYESGDAAGQAGAARYADYPVSELPYVKVAIADDMNDDGTIDWNDGAIAYRDIMNVPYGSEKIKDLVNYRIVMNFASMAPNPYLATADNIKKVYLATDGLPQAVMLKGYGNEGHDSANSEYADIAEREGGVKDFRNLIKIAHDYNTEIGIHVNAQEVYPEARSYNTEMAPNAGAYGWGWLDQSHVIDKLWDLSSQARWKRLVQLYDRINNTNHLNRNWEKGEYVSNSLGTVDVSKEALQEEAKNRPDNMDFIYLDVWYQNSWETRQIAKEFNSLDWRFSTEFGTQGEYDSTWQHWATDTNYGGAAMKGFNSDIIRFIRNDQRDSQVLNNPAFGGTADNPLLGGYQLYGFEGWGGDRDFNNYLLQTFNKNLPTKFLQHYQVVDWESYAEGESPVGNTEKKITLANGKIGDENTDVVVVERKSNPEDQRADDNIERTITLNGKKVLDDVTYLLPWTEGEGENKTEKLYHWNLEGGTTKWQLPDGWDETQVVMYELSDQGRINKTPVAADADGFVTLKAKPATAYVIVKEEGVKTLKKDFGECDYVVDPGFNGYAAGEKLSADEWSGDIDAESVVVEKAATGDQRLAFNSPTEEVAVTTTISGLTAGTSYVAEVNVQNDSDKKAFITVNAGKKKVSNYTESSIIGNYVKCDMKNGTKMQRMQIAFTAESDKAELTLSRAAGAGSTYMDDIRIVEKTVDNFKADGSFVQDFESVVQGLYPFVLSSAQGITDPVTHLSQDNGNYTAKGWGGKATDDVIAGEWSLKHHGSNTGIIYQTIPQNFRFEPGKTYQVTFDYLSAPNQAYAMVIGNGTQYTTPTAYFAQATDKAAPGKGELTVTGEGNGLTWIGLYERGSYANGNNAVGGNDFILDNLVIREVKDASSVVLEKTELYKGETSAIYAINADDITWTSSKPTVAVAEDGVVKALAAGTATLTATFGGTTKTFEITVVGGVASTLPREEFSSISSTANTEEKTGEQAPNGFAGAATDGKESTYWHSQWQDSNFAVSESNPAVLTVDLGKEMEIGGFRFLPRNGNGMVEKYSYRILAADGTVVASGSHIAVSGPDWKTAQLDDIVEARKIEISVESGKNGNAAICEVEPIKLEKVAEGAALADVTMQAGAAVTLEPTPVGGTMLKGLVWDSSDKDVATVNEYGVVKAAKAGTTTITVTNAAGLFADCTVTVTPKLYHVTVEGGKFDGKTDGDYAYNTKLTVIADETTGNQNFAGWLVNDELLSTEKEYTFYVGTNLTIKAQYADKAPEIQPQAYLQDVTVTKSASAGKYDIRYLVQLVVPKNATINAAGLVWRTTDTKDPKELEIGATGAKVTSISKISTTYQFSVTVKGVPADKTVPGRAYATIDGATVYSDNIGRGITK